MAMRGRDERGFPDFAETRLPVSQARHMPGYVYTSSDILEQEKQTIFLRDWLCVGRVEEIEKSGDYMALRIMDEPVLVVRNKEGAINAFSNICLHRGVEIVTGTGNAREFACPFHGWLYGLDGRLIGAPLMRETENFDLTQCRLSQLRCELWHGWIFVTFDGAAPSLARHVASMEQDFGYLRPDECRLAIKSEGELDCNWKLVVENLIDFYHLNVVHTSTNGRTFTRQAFKFSPRAHGGYVAEYNSGPSTPSGKPVFGRMPWLDDKAENFATAGRLEPNFILFARVDDIHPYVVWPLGVNKTRIVVYTLLPKMYFDAPDFDEKVLAYRQFQEQIMQEDSAMLQSVQNSMASHRYQPGRMASIERGVHHVMNGYLDRMSVEP